VFRHGSNEERTMARQSFRGAGGAGAVVVPYDAVVLPYEHRSAGSDYEVATISPAQPTEADRRIAGALAIVASGVLVAVAVFAAGWTLSG
jgi:hypothetical protein